MTAYVYVSLKKSVLDPQGKTIHGALKKMGYKGLEGVRQGKYFELTLDGGLSREDAQSEFSLVDLSFGPPVNRLVLAPEGMTSLSFGRSCLIIWFHKHPWIPERHWSQSDPLSPLASYGHQKCAEVLHHAR